MTAFPVFQASLQNMRSIWLDAQARQYAHEAALDALNGLASKTSWATISASALTAVLSAYAAAVQNAQWLPGVLVLAVLTTILKGIEQTILRPESFKNHERARAEYLSIGRSLNELAGWISTYLLGEESLVVEELNSEINKQADRFTQIQLENSISSKKFSDTALEDFERSHLASAMKSLAKLLEKQLNVVEDPPQLQELPGGADGLPEDAAAVVAVARPING